MNPERDNREQGKSQRQRVRQLARFLSRKPFLSVFKRIILVFRAWILKTNMTSLVAFALNTDLHAT